MKFKAQSTLRYRYSVTTADGTTEPFEIYRTDAAPVVVLDPGNMPRVYKFRRVSETEWALSAVVERDPRQGAERDWSDTSNPRDTSYWGRMRETVRRWPVYVPRKKSELLVLGGLRLAMVRLFTPVLVDDEGAETGLD